MQNDLNLNNILEFSGVSKQYPEEKNQAVHDISFSVKSNEFVCLIGPSGCGKSTILKLIAGLIEPSQGRIKKPENISMSFQSGALFPWRTVFDNVALGLQANHASEPKITKEVWTYLEMMRLQDLANSYPADLSGGQRQRVGIARALAVSPSVLLLDEPFSALDPKITAELHDDIISVWKTTKKTIIMVSHLIEEAVSLADRILLMKEGLIIKEYPIALPYPRREQGMAFLHHVQEIRKDFFSGSE